MKLIPVVQWGEQQTPPLKRARASLLAKQGRIPGAVMLGNRWFVPMAAQRKIGRLKR